MQLLKRKKKSTYKRSTYKSEARNNKLPYLARNIVDLCVNVYVMLGLQSEIKTLKVGSDWIQNSLSDWKLESQGLVAQKTAESLWDNRRAEIFITTSDIMISTLTDTYVGTYFQSKWWTWSLNFSLNVKMCCLIRVIMVDRIAGSRYLVICISYVWSVVC